MDKLTRFCIGLTTNKQMSVQFNSGNNEAEINKNRTGMLIEAGMGNIEEALHMSPYDLISLTDERFVERYETSLPAYDGLKTNYIGRG